MNILVGVNIIGLPIYHSIKVQESKNVKYVVRRNVALKSRHNVYRGLNGNIKNKK